MQTMPELLRLVPVLQKYGDTTFSIVIAWAISTLGKAVVPSKSSHVPR